MTEMVRNMKERQTTVALVLPVIIKTIKGMRNKRLMPKVVILIFFSCSSPIAFPLINPKIKH